MPIFKENTESTGEYYEPVNNRNIDLYVQQFGKDRAEGYQDCMFDLLKKISHILIQPTDDQGGGFENSPAYMRRHLWKLFKEESSIFENLASSIRAADPDAPPSDYPTNLKL